MLTVITCLKCSCDVRLAHDWEFVPLPICERSCEEICICPSTHIRCGHNECTGQRGNIWVHRNHTQEEIDGVVWFTPRPVSVFCNVQDEHSKYQYYEEFPMGGNPTVYNFWGTFVLVGRVEASSVDKWCIMRKERRPGGFIPLLLIRWNHGFMDFSVWPHVDIVRQW